MVKRLHPLSQSYGTDTTRRHPRSLADAFPDARADPFDIPEPRTWRTEDRVVTWLMAALAIVLIVAVSFGAEWLPGGGA